MPSEAFRRIQIGKETTAGTKVAADKKLMGTLTMTPDFGKRRTAEDRGSLAMNRRDRSVLKRTDMRFEGDATYDQIIDFLGMGVKGGVSGSAQTTSYEWTYTPSLTASNAQDTYTFEYGDEEQEFECGYVMCSQLTIAFTMGEIARLSADLFGQSTAKSTFTADPGNPATEELVANELDVWIDGTWANLGTTQKSDLVVGGQIVIPTGLVPTWRADGSLEFNTVAEQKRAIRVELEYVTGTRFETEYDAYAADPGTDRALRLQFTGDNIDTGEDHRFRLDMMGRYIEPPRLMEVRDGENLVRMVMESFEDTSGNEYSILVENIIATT